MLTPEENAELAELIEAEERDRQAARQRSEEEDIKRAQDSFLGFYERMTGFTAPPHIKLMCKVGQALEDDKIDRAIIAAPPRHAKSTLFSQLLPAWVMGRNPKSKIMSTVHTGTFARKIGKYVRNMMLRPQWPFPDVTLAPDSQAKDQFATPQGGEYNAFGVGGSQHGNPAEWLFMDDLIKDRSVAMSDVMREEVWDVYTTDLASRLEGRSKQVLVATRWIEDDPTGRILPESFDGQCGFYLDRDTGQRWYVLSLPAVAESHDDPLGRKPGEYLWPDRFGPGSQVEAAYKRGGYNWAALYQQRPSPQEGLMFQQEHIQRYSIGKLNIGELTIYGSSDYAVTAEAGSNNPDYTVHMIWGVDSEWNVFLLDMWRGRTTSDVWIDEFIKLVIKWSPLMWAEEQGQILKSVGPFLVQRMLEENAFVHRRQYTSATNKEMRAQSLLGMASLGRLYLPNRDEVTGDFLTHLDAFEKELMQFPTGRHDDTVDTSSIFSRMLASIIAGEKPPPVSPHGETLDDLYRRHDEQERRSD